MAFSDAFLPEFDQEMKTTRSLLERVPMDKASWKPHIRSTALGPLATHVANLAGFANAIVVENEVDLAQAGVGDPNATAENTEALLAMFDANVASARQSIGGMAEVDAMTPWTLRSGDHVIAAVPRAAALRTMMMSHIIHHRGQLSVYLRLNDVPLPSIYGPTADT